MTEREKLEHGFWYDANYDKELLEQRTEAEALCFSLNQTNPKETEKREDIIKKLLPHKEADITILSPFCTDYGYNCFIGEFTFINHNAYLMDCAPIKIGSHCFIGPNCGMYTAIHPFLANERNKGLEKARPITVGDNVWIGADVTILPGVTIGANSVIGAKSVVTKDIPNNVIALGNPCRVLREITKQDSIWEEIANEEKNIK